MTSMELITLVSCILGMMVTIGALIRPIINLNLAIQKLNDTVSALQGDMESYKFDAKALSEEISSIDTRLTIIETKMGVQT